jgi:glycosyltransferase involved in cell wall biosynthesis
VHHNGGVMTEQDYKVSVVLTAYNTEKYIRAAVQSILDQTYSPDEFIIVDDCSKDKTVEILREMAGQDARIRLIALEKNVGYANARNVAMEQAAYPWIAIMDADDVAYPERLEKQRKAAQGDPEVVVWGSYMTRITENGDPLGMVDGGPTSKEAFYAIDRTQKLISLFAPTSFFRKDIALKVGGFRQENVPSEDSELWDRMAEYGAVVVLPEPLLNYRQHWNSISVVRMVDQIMMHEYIIERYRQRMEGHELTVAEFKAAYQNRPFLERISRNLLVRSMARGRKARFAKSQKDYFGIVYHGVMSLLLHPKRYLFGRKSSMY